LNGAFNRWEIQLANFQEERKQEMNEDRKWW